MLTNPCFYAFCDAFRVLHIHTKKLFNLGLELSKVSHDRDKLIFNYSCYTLLKSEKVYSVKV